MKATPHARIEALLQRGWARPQPGPLARLAQPLSWGVGWIAQRRAERLQAAAPRQARPVIVVGSLWAGGSGKTPWTIALLGALAARGWRAAVVTRGYGRSGEGLALLEADHALTPADARRHGDEPCLILRRCRVPMAVCADRARAAQALIERHPSIDVIVADDGLQHRRLARDVELCVVDERGFGNGLTLPAGPLREPPSLFEPTPGLFDEVRGGRRPPPHAPTHAGAPLRAMLYNAPRASLPWPGATAHRLLQPPVALDAWWSLPPAVPAAPRADACALAEAGEDAPAPSTHPAWAAWAHRRVDVAAAIARPARFAQLLEAHGIGVDHLLALADHAPLDPPPWPADAPRPIVVTEKDAIKLDPAAPANARVWVAALDLQPDAAPLARLLDAIDAVLRRAGRTPAFPEPALPSS